MKPSTGVLLRRATTLLKKGSQLQASVGRWIGWEIVMALLEWGVSLVIGMVERVWPALSVVTEWLPI